MGRLFRGVNEVGLVLVTIEPYAEASGGRLWWTRWGRTHDILWLWSIVDGVFSDEVVPDDAADDELTGYDSGRFMHYGEALRVAWLSQEESTDLRASAFGR